MSTTPEQLSDLMEFGRVIRVDSPDRVYASRPKFIRSAEPEEVQYVDLDADGGASEPEAPAKWTFLTGFTGQYSYHGACMHPSEYIGGRLADHILETPGYYVAVIIDAYPIDDSAESETVGWGILHYIG